MKSSTLEKAVLRWGGSVQGGLAVKSSLLAGLKARWHVGPSGFVRRFLWWRDAWPARSSPPVEFLRAALNRMERHGPHVLEARLSRRLEKFVVTIAPTARPWDFVDVSAHWHMALELPCGIFLDFLMDAGINLP